MVKLGFCSKMIFAQTFGRRCNGGYREPFFISRSSYSTTASEASTAFLSEYLAASLGFSREESISTAAKVQQLGISNPKIMSTPNFKTIFLLSLLPFLLNIHRANGDLQMGYYSESCPRAEEIIKEQVTNLYEKHGNTAVSWLRNLFHDCMVKSCDASILLDTVAGEESEKASPRNFGMRNFKYIQTIKSALEEECPNIVSCADIVALSARDGAVMLGGPRAEMKTGRKDSKENYLAEVENFIPNHNDSMELVLSRFQSIGVDTEGTVALLGAHTVGRVHCINLVHRLYPTVDPTMDPTYADYLKLRCPSADPDPRAVEPTYSRNDRRTPMILDNMYYKNILEHKGLLVVDEQLATHPATSPFVEKMAADNIYFHDQFSRAMVILSENNPLTGDQGEIRKDCRFVNRN